MIEKLLSGNLSIQEFIENAQPKEIIALYNILIKKDEVPLKLKYSLLSDLVNLYPNVSVELYEIALTKLFEHYETKEYFEKLKSFYENKGKYKEIIQLTDYFSNITEDENEKAKLYMELGNFYNENLLQPDIALKFYNKSMQLNPDNEDLEENIDEILMAKNNWEKMVENFENKLNSTDDPNIKSMYYLNIAEIHLNHSENIDKAKEYLLKSLDINPKNEDIPLLIKRVFVDRGNLDEIVDFIITKLNEVEDQELKDSYKDILYTLLRDYRVAKKHGLKIYKTLLSLNSDDKDLINSIINYSIEHEKYDEFIEIIENLLKKTTDKEKQLYFTNLLIEFIYNYTDNLEKAEFYAKKSEALDPENFKYDYIYLEFYKQKGNNRKVFEILTKKIKSLDDEDEIIELYKEIAEVAEAANNMFKVTDSYKSILKIRPGDKDAIESLKRIYKEGKKWRALLGLLKDYISYLEKDLENNLEEIIYTQEEIIELTATQLKQDTTNLYKKLLQYDPKNITALNYLLEFNKSKNRWNEYIKILIQKSEAVDDFEKIEIYFQIAEIYTQKLRKSLEAAVYYEKVLDIEPDNGDALENLKEIYQNSKKYDKLYDLNIREIKLSQSNDTKIEMLKELYDFTIQNLKNDNERIEKIINLILEIDENNIFAYEKLLEKAKRENNTEKQKEVLQKLYELDKTPEIILSLAKINDTPEYQNEAINYYLEYIQENKEDKEVIKRLIDLYFEKSDYESIDSLFETVEDYELYYDTILQIINKTNDDKRKKYALKLIEISENYIDDNDKLLKALTDYNNYYHDNLEIIDKIKQIYQENDNKDALFSIIKEKIKLVETQEEKIEIFEELTNLFMEFEKYEDAFQNEKEKFLLTKDISIIDNLNELSMEINNRELFVNTIIDLIKNIDDIDIKEELYNRAIEVYTELDRYEDGRALYFELIELKPKLKYINNLIDLLSLLDDFENLVKVYDKKLEFLNEEEKIELLKEMAGISFNKNKKTEEAVSYLKMILEIDENNLSAINMLMFFYSSENRYKEWIEVALNKLNLTEGEELEKLYLEIAKTYFENLNDLDNFKVYYDKYLEISLNQEALSDLEEIYFDTKYLPLLEVLLKYYEKIEDFEKIRTILEKTIDEFDLNEEDYNFYKLKLADVIAENFKDYQLAYQYKKDVYIKDLSNNEILNSLEELSSQMDDFSDLISLLRQYKDTVNEKMVRINILARLGKIYDIYMKEHETAQSFYNTILEEDGDNLEILKSLEKIYLESENYEMLHDILLKKHRLLSEEEKLLNKVALAKVEGLYFNKIEEAIELLDSVLDIDETIIEAYETKKMFYKMQGKNDEIINILLTMEDMLKTNDEYIINVISELGNIYAQTDKQKALKHYLEVHDTLSETSRTNLRNLIFDLLSDDSELLNENLENLTQFFKNRKLWNSLIKLYELMIDFTDSTESKRKYYENIYNIYNEHLGDKEKIYKTLFNLLKYGKEEENQDIVNQIFTFEFEDKDTIINRLENIAEEKEGDYVIYKKIAQVYQQEEDIEKSNLYYLKAFKNRPEDEELYENLLNYYQEKEDYNTIKEIYFFKADAVEDIDEKVSYLDKAAEIERNFIKDIDAAAEIYMKIYGINHSVSMLETLEIIYRENEKWNELIELYKKAVEYEEEYYDKKVYLSKIIDIYTNILNKPENSVEFIKIIIENEPQEPENYALLINIHKNSENFEELDKVYELQINNLLDEDREVALLSRAKNAKEKLNDYDKAIESLKMLLTVNPYNEEALIYLESFLNEEEYILKTYEILENIYEILSKWEELSELYNLVLEQNINKELRLQIYSKLSNVYKEYINNFDKSLEFALKYFEENPNDTEMIENIESLLDITDSHILFINSIDRVLSSLENKSAPESTEENEESEKEETTSYDNTELKLNLLTKKSEIAEDFIEDKRIAIKALYQLIEAVPENIEYYEKLSSYLTELGIFNELVELLFKQVEVTTSQEEKIDLLNRIAQIYKEMLSDLPKAVETYQKILEIDEANLSAMDELEIILDELEDEREVKISVLNTLEVYFEKLEEWERYIATLKRKIEFTEDKNEQKNIFLKISSISKDYLNNFEEAYEFYQKAFVLDYDNEVGEKLLELTDVLSNYEDFVNFMEEHINKLEAAELKDKLHLKLGNLYFEYIDDTQKAKEHLLKYSSYRNDIDVLKKLEVIYQDEGNFKELENIYDMLSQQYQDNNEKIEVLQKLATIQEYELNDKESTIKTLNKIIEISPDNIDILKSLEELNQGNTEALAGIYQLMLNTELTDEERTEVLIKLGRILKEKSELEEAEKIWNEIIELNIEKKEAYINLIEYYNQTNNIEKLAASYENYLSEYGYELEDEERIKILLTLADIYKDEEKLNDYTKAIEKFREILEIDPQYIKALIELRDIYLNNDYIDEFFDIMRVMISTLEQGYEDLQNGYEDSQILEYAKNLNIDIKTLLYDSFEILENKLMETENYDEAVQVASRDLDIFPKRIETLDRLIQVYEKQDMYDELIVALTDKLEIMENDDDKLELYQKIADISLDSLGDIPRAIESYKEIINIDNKNIEVIEKLIKLYENIEEWDEIIPLLELKLSITDDNYDIYIEIIDILTEKVGNFEKAFEYIFNTLNIFKNNEELLNKLNILGEISGLWDLYIETSVKVLEIIDEENLKNSLINKIAQVYRDELGDIENSIKYYKALQERLPQNKDVLYNLENLYSQEAMWNELTQVYQKIIQLEEDDTTKKEYYYKLAANYEENLDKPNEAAAVLEELISLYENETEALDNLERLYNDLENYPKLTEVYQKQIKNLDDYEEKINLWLQIINLAQDFDKNLVIRAYEEILKLDTNNEEAFEILQQHFKEENNFDKLKTLYTDLIENDSNFKIEATLKLAKILENEDQSKAIELYYEVINNYEPENINAADSLIEIFKQNSDWDNLIELYKQLLDIENEQSRRVNYLNSLAKIYSDIYNDLETAKDYYDLALQENPASKEATEGLFKIFEAQENWEEIINLLSDVANSTEDSDQAADAFYKIGLIHETKLNSLEEAKSAYELAVENKYDFIDAILKLKQISLTFEDYESTITYLENLKDLTQDTDKLVELNNEIGELYLNKLNDSSSAIYAFEESLNLKNNFKAVINLTNLYFNNEDFESLNKIYDEHFEEILNSDRQNKEIHYFKRAMTKNKLSIEPESVYEYSLQAFKLNKLFKDNLELLFEISDKLNKPETLIPVAKQRLVHYFDEIETTELGNIYVKLGVAYSELKEFERGEKYFNRALIIDEYNIDALKFAVDSYRRAAQWPKVIEYYNKILKKLNDYDETLKIHYEMALIYKNELKNYQKSIKHFEYLINENLKNLNIINHMLEIYETVQDNEKIISVLEEKLNFVDNNDEKEKIYYRLADLYYSKFNDLKNSLKYLIKILEFNYGNTKIITAIEKLLTSVSAFQDLEKIYLTILSKLSSDDKELMKYIYLKLSSLYTNELQNFENAVNTYEKLLKLEPENQEIRQKLIDLCERLPKYYNRAIELHLETLNSGLKTDSLHSLIRLYSESKNYDRAFCYTALLVHLNEATDDELQFYNSYRPIAQIKISQTLSTVTLERYVYPKGTNTDINRIFAKVSSIIADFYRKKKVKHIKDIDYKRGLMPKESRAYKVAANVMNAIGLPNYDFYKSISFKGIRIENTKPQTVIVIGNDMVADREDTETAFYMGRHLFYLLPEFYLVDISESVGIGIHEFFKVILSVFIPAIQVGKEYAKLQKILRKTTPPDTAALIEKLANSGSVDLNPWLKQIELAANRIGLIMSGDINKALKVIREDASSFSKLTLKEKVDDLIKYSISNEYLELREALNITIKIK